MSEAKDTPPSHLDARVKRAEVSLVYAQARAGFVLSLFNGAVFFGLLFHVIPVLHLSLWFAFLALVTFGRMLLVRAHARAPIDDGDASDWRRRFVVSSFFGGLAWGILGGALFPESSVAYQLAIGFVLAGLAAGSVAYFSSVPAAYYAFAGTALIPYAARLFAIGGVLQVTLGGLTVLYVGALAANVHRVNGVIRESFRVGFANEELVEKLRGEVDERTRAEARRAESEELFRGAFDSVAAGMCLLDEGGRYVRVNDAMCAMLGYTRPELLSLGAFDIVPPEDAEKLRARFANVNDANDELFEERVQTKNGRERWVQGSMRTLREANGGSSRFVVQFVDVTERRAVDKMKAEFIATVSHELRTPLTSIQGAVDLLAGGVGGALPETARDLAVTAAANAVRLRKLVDDLLDFERLGADTLTLAPRRVRLLPLLDEAVACAAPFAQRHSVRIERTASDDIEVDTDPDRLAQVITNLLSNAAKFSRAGSFVETNVRVDQGRAIVSVRDYGVGIPESFRGRVFQKFSQVDSSDARAKGGTGLGLSISKAIMDKLGGELSYESQVGVGTTFRIAIPVAGTP
ncbi:MAG: ATP-binding protein [Polyangiaceae bacterium]